MEIYTQPGKRSVADSVHPFVLLAYFVVVITLSVAFFHPIVTGISLIGATLFATLLSGKRVFGYLLKFVLPIGLLTLLANVLFVHRGVTVLWMLGENPITKEATVYGACAALMMGAVLVWFFCFGQLMTAEKFMYLFGKRAPAASLILSMTMRFVPRFAKEAKVIAEARKGIGCRSENGTMKENARTMSIMTTWALENSMTTSESMRARGFGTAKRTQYEMYRKSLRDYVILAGVVALAAVSILLCATFTCYPVIRHEEPAGGVSAFAVLCLAPAMADITEGIRWHHSLSKI